MAKASTKEFEDKSGSRIDAIYQALFKAILAQELMPGKVGMIAGLFFGLAFGIAGIGSAAACGRCRD